MNDGMVFQFIGETVTNATNAFVTPSANKLMITLQMTALAGVTLYLTLTAYAIMTGAAEAPARTLFKQCVKIIIIAMFALSVDGYVNGVMGALNDLEVGLSDALVTGTAGGSPSTSIYQTLDKSLNNGLDSVKKCFEMADKAGFNIGSALGWAIAGLTVMIGTILVSMLGGAVVIVAKFSIAVMFAIGPFFILCLMFPVTAKFFDSWFSQVMNYILTVVIITIVMSFAMKAFDTFILAADFSGSGSSNPMFAAMQIGALTGVLCLIIKQVGSMASGLAGGVSMTAMGIRHLVAPVTGGAKAAMSAYNTVNPMVTRRDMQSGMMSTTRLSQHYRAGNTKFNPAYKQYLAENRNNNWGPAKGGKVQQ